MEDNNEYKLITMEQRNQWGYKYNVQLWTNGRYYGNGKFFKTKKEANVYIKNKNKSTIKRKSYSKVKNKSRNKSILWDLYKRDLKMYYETGKLQFKQMSDEFYNEYKDAGGKRKRINLSLHYIK